MVTAIILAGGKGKRIGADISKQYIPIQGKPMLYYTIKKFSDNEFVDRIILVVSKDEIGYCKEEVIKKYNLNVDNIVCGGSERQDSVYNGLVSAKGSDIVLIHDGARPFVSEKIIQQAVKYAKQYGAAAPGVIPKDTIKIKDSSNFSIKTLDRDSLVSIQTPQAFAYNIIFDAHKRIRKLGISVTDDTMVAEYYNNKVYMFPGEYTNIKITTPEDLFLAEYLVKL